MAFRSILLCLCLWGSAALCGEEVENPAVRLYDTGTPSAKPLSEDAVAKREGWNLVPEDNLTHEFTGFAAIQNNRLTFVFRNGYGLADVYAHGENGAKLRAKVGYGTKAPFEMGHFRAMKVIENTSGAVMVEALYSTPSGPTLRFRLAAGEAILEIRPGGGASSVLVASMAPKYVVPDFFGDDMLFWGDSGTELPTENFLVGLIFGRDSILMCGWQSSRQAVTTCSEAPKSVNGKVEAWSLSQITCERENKVWLALLEGKSIWAYGENAKNWRPPFPARWRCSRTSRTMESYFADSWDMGERPIPENDDEGLTFIYPLDRTRETPLTAFTLVDLMRNTMGKGPCQYVLDQEGLASEENLTPDLAMAWVEKQFQRKAAAKAADEMAGRLKGMVEQVRLTQARIGKYAAFARSIRALCTAEKAPDLASALLATVKRIEQTLKADTEAAATSERAGQLAAEVVALARKQGTLEECQRLAAQVRAIGVAQDRALSKCRMATRWLRSQAKAVAGEPDCADLAKQVDALSERMLWKP